MAKRTPLKLMLGALVAFAVLMLLLMRPATYDPQWWRHLGLGVLHPRRPRAPRRPLGPPSPMRQGIEYFSDYDIDAVTLSPDPPPLHPGDTPAFAYINASAHPEYHIKFVSDQPRVAVIDGLLTDEEADAIVTAAAGRLERSQVNPFKKEYASSANTQTDVRTSSQAWLPVRDEPAWPVVDKLLELTGFPIDSTEDLQVLKYEKGQKYDAHNDYFDPKYYGPQPNQRAVTVFLYLNNVEEGGETQFPRADGKPPTFDFTSCTRGLRVHPVKGRVVIFYDMKPNRALDDYSLHGGCPVKRGIKWGGTLWLRVPTP